jgi:hypothetical protein
MPRPSVRSTKDLWSGLIFIAVGLGGIAIARDYPMGRALKMGPAFFPTILAALLVLIGALVLVRAFAIEGTGARDWAFRGAPIVLGGMVVFAMLLRGVGLALSIVVLVVVSAAASIRFRLSAAAILAVCLAAFCSLVFVVALGLPMPILGRWIGF